MMEYYTSLKNFISSGGQSDSAPTSLKPPVPNNIDAIIEDIEASNDRGEDRERFVVASFLLANSYKINLWSARVKHMKQYTKKSIKERSNHTDETVNVKSYSVNKFDYIRDSFLECTSLPIKLAIAIYLGSSLPISLKRDFIFAIINDSENDYNVSFIIKMFSSDLRQTGANIRKYITTVKSNKIESAVKQYILCGLIELSELLKDKMYCKLAMEIDAQRYIKYVQKYLELNIIHSIVPFEAAISKYLKISIAQCDQIIERKTVYSHFKINPIEAINIVIRGLPNPKKLIDGVVKKTSLNFDADVQYQYYKGPLGYTRDLVMTHYTVGHEIYKIITYNECLYDVLGRMITSTDQNGQVTRVDEIFDNLCWMDRLKMLPEYRVKVIIYTMSGAELNLLSGESADITVAYFDKNNIACMKTYAIRKPKSTANKIKTES